jgi:hypothetical protein
MSTVVRSELSENNLYWIPKHRYYELKLFCLQYPIWKKAYLALDGFCSHSADLIEPTSDSQMSDPTGKHVEARQYFLDRLQMVDLASREANVALSFFILKAVTEGVSYEYLKTKLEIPCCKEKYYNAYRKFFWILNKTRD